MIPTVLSARAKQDVRKEKNRDTHKIQLLNGTQYDLPQFQSQQELDILRFYSLWQVRAFYRYIHPT